jgi:hypothetical protein
MLLQLHMLLPTVSLPVLAQMLLPPEDVPGLMLATAAALGPPVEGFRAAAGVGLTAGGGSMGSLQLGSEVLQDAGVLMGALRGVGDIVDAVQGWDLREDGGAGAAGAGRGQQLWSSRNSSEWLLQNREALLGGARTAASAGIADSSGGVAAPQAFKEYHQLQEQQKRESNQSASQQVSPVLAGLPSDLDIGSDLVVSPPSLRIPELDLRSEYKDGHSSFIAVGPQPAPLAAELTTAAGATNAAEGTSRRVSAASLPDDLPGSVVPQPEGDNGCSRNSSRRCDKAVGCTGQVTLADPVEKPSVVLSYRSPSASAIPSGVAGATTAWHSRSSRGELGVDGALHGAATVGGFLGNFGAIGEPGTPPLASTLEKFHGKGVFGSLGAFVLPPSKS